MTVYVALLRAINVGGSNLIAMPRTWNTVVRLVALMERTRDEIGSVRQRT